jgi:CHC2 zinc finger
VIATRMSPAELYLRVLTERAPQDTLLEVRYRRQETPTDSPWSDFKRFFIDIQTLRRRMSSEASFIASIGHRTDVYVGCAPRLRYSGCREDIAPAAILWADCDTPSAIQALQAFTPAPTMTVESGSATYQEERRLEHKHAYWALTHPLVPKELETANRRLAAALGADPSCVDPARVLRVPHTLNFKHSPPSPTRLFTLTDKTYRPQNILAALPELPASSVHKATRRNQDPAAAEDPLERIHPRTYVHVLTGRDPGRSGKIHCPFHADRRPSFHVYNTPEQGWTCFACTTPTGCPLGGDIYTLASLLWLTGQSQDVPLRGRQFVEVRRRLMEIFFGEGADV